MPFAGIAELSLPLPMSGTKNGTPPSTLAGLSFVAPAVMVVWFVGGGEAWPMPTDVRRAHGLRIARTSTVHPAVGWPSTRLRASDVVNSHTSPPPCALAYVEPSTLRAMRVVTAGRSASANWRMKRFMAPGVSLGMLERTGAGPAATTPRSGAHRPS